MDRNQCGQERGQSGFPDTDVLLKLVGYVVANIPQQWRILDFPCEGRPVIFPTFPKNPVKLKKRIGQHREASNHSMSASD